ncbi:MAG: AAA family ATPase [Eubacteriaceae bacterium]|nr:AAA family ATPase [Eubacteriaceae bacterium]
MNIKQAKQQVENAIRAYLQKDEYGTYVIPAEKQRPLFIIGPSGIGKTAIIRQIANKMGIGLVSYSMTHHTRQSAIGLPYIVQKNFAGRQYAVSEYTMSEIISTVYETMEETGIKEGILFLDEINCVSETLAPAMLQFLQYKVFGRHSVPEGWVVVTAGNPPEYNDSVREFDIVTLDRLKVVQVEADLSVWKEYAYEKAVHGSVMAYLDVRKSDFYYFEVTPEGKSFVTARGWEDLSDMIKLYEKLNIPVNYDLVSQYIQNNKVAKDFSVYYDLYKKYAEDYKTDEILAGKADLAVKNSVRRAKFTERLSLLGLLIDEVSSLCRSLTLQKDVLSRIYPILLSIKEKLISSEETYGAALLEEAREALAEKTVALGKAGILTKDDGFIINTAAAFLDECRKNLTLAGNPAGREGFEMIKEAFSKKTAEKDELILNIGGKMDNMFKFLEEVFGDGQEMLVAVAELTANPHTAVFIASYGCEGYSKHNKELLFFERQIALNSEIEQLGEL